jgi:hypothetical protein
MLTRRSFLGGLFGSAAALVIARLPAPDVAALDTPVASLNAPELAPTIQAAASYLLQTFLEERKRMGWPVSPADVFPEKVMVGNVLPNGRVVTHQLNVSAIGSLDKDRMLLPAATALAHGSVQRGMDVFGCLDIPQHVEQCQTAGPIRLIVAYDYGHDATMTCVDIVGGCSPAALKRLERERQHRLVLSIKRKRGLITA